jgi:hypothetical protein
MYPVKYTFLGLWANNPILLSKFATPFADGFIGDDHPTDEHQFFDVAITQAEPEKEPHTVADDLRRKAMACVWVGCRSSVHAASMP